MGGPGGNVRDSTGTRIACTAATHKPFACCTFNAQLTSPHVRRTPAPSIALLTSCRSPKRNKYQRRRTFLSAMCCTRPCLSAALNHNSRWFVQLTSQRWQTTHTYKQRVFYVMEASKPAQCCLLLSIPLRESQGPRVVNTATAHCCRCHSKSCKASTMLHSIPPSLHGRVAPWQSGNKLTSCTNNTLQLVMYTHLAVQTVVPAANHKPLPKLHTITTKRLEDQPLTPLPLPIQALLPTTMITGLGHLLGCSFPPPESSWPHTHSLLLLNFPAHMAPNS
jgi:hypothetical protein